MKIRYLQAKCSHRGDKKIIRWAGCSRSPLFSERPGRNTTPEKSNESQAMVLRYLWRSNWLKGRLSRHFVVESDTPYVGRIDT